MKRKRDWLSIDWERLSVAPKAPGVYVFYSAGKPIYIGSTSNLRGRLRSHFQHQKPPWHEMIDACKICQVDRLGGWLELEWRLVFRLSPDMNSKVALYGRDGSNPRVSFALDQEDWGGRYGAVGKSAKLGTRHRVPRLARVY